MIYYAIKQSVSYKETIVLNIAVSESSFKIMYEQLDGLKEDQFTFKVYRLTKSDFDVLKNCSNHNDTRQTMLFQFSDRGSILKLKEVVAKKSNCSITNKFREEQLNDFDFDDLPF